MARVVRGARSDHKALSIRERIGLVALGLFVLGCLIVVVLLEQWHTALEGLGIERRRLHDLRDTTATLLFGEGTELRTVGDQLGHAGLQVTSDRYVGRVPQTLRRVADQLDALLSGAFDQQDDASEQG